MEDTEEDGTPSRTTSSDGCSEPSLIKIILSDASRVNRESLNDTCRLAKGEPSGKRTFLGTLHRDPEHPFSYYELSDGLDMGNVWLKTSDSNR